MFRELLSLFGQVLLLLIGLVLLSCSDNTENICAIPVCDLKPGDIAFRRGEGIVSEVVLLKDSGGTFSHVGIVVEQNDSVKVVHAVPGELEGSNDFDRVRMVDINVYYGADRASHGEIVRIELTDSQCAVINRLAIDKARAKVPFDHNYDVQDTTKLYCTELVQLLFSKIGVDLSEGRITPINFPSLTNDYIMPSDIRRNSQLQSIYIY